MNKPNWEKELSSVEEVAKTAGKLFVANIRGVRE